MKQLLTHTWKKLNFGKSIQLRIMRIFQDEFLVGLTGVILDDKDRVLVVNHSYRDGDYWSLPGGYMKGKETPREGLAREIEEETGLIVFVEKEVRTRTDRETARLDISLVGRYVSGEFTPSDEVKQAAFFAFEDLPRISQNQLLLIRSILQSRKKEEKNALKKPERASLWKKLSFFKKNKESSDSSW